MSKFFTLLFLFVTFYSNAKIITIDKINNIEIEFAKANNETLVVFDLDNVILESVERAFQSDDQKVVLGLIKKYSEKQSQDEKEQINATLWKIGVQLVDSKMPLLITVLQSRGIKTLLLTANYNEKVADIESIESLCYLKLKKLGIDFEKSWRNFNRINFKETESKGKKFIPFLGNGMIFTCRVSKGEILKEFLSKLPQYKFRKVIFIDDSLKNIKSVEKVMNELNVEFVGIEYTYAKTKKRPPLDMEKVKKQCEILIKEKRWMSDAETENYERNQNFVKPVN